MIWDPVFDPEGSKVAAKVEQSGCYSIAINGKVWKKKFEGLWEPVFSPDGKKILVKAIEDGKYYRRVVEVQEILG